MFFLLLKDFIVLLIVGVYDFVVIVKVVDLLLRGLENLLGDVFLDLFFNFFMRVYYIEDNNFKLGESVKVNLMNFNFRNNRDVFVLNFNVFEDCNVVLFFN